MRGYFSLLSLIIIFNLNSQINVENDITKPSLSKNSLAEKIYLQIDNTIYQTGEKIWFKAIVSKSYNNGWSEKSKVLHVELIDSNNRIIEAQLLKLNNGTTNGSFVLQEGYKTGKYKIRAYTFWNRNFEEDFMFFQSIDVVNIKEQKTENDPIINVVISTGDFKTLQVDIKPNIVAPDFKGNLQLYIDTGKQIDSVELRKSNNEVYHLNYKLPENTTQAELKFIKTPKNRFNSNEEEFHKKTIVIDKDYLDIQFFPEGGQLVNGLLSTVGYKAINYNGLGEKVKGEIKDNNGNSVTSFISNVLGMGTFIHIPKPNTTYYAEIINDEILYTYNIPVAKSEGSVLSLGLLKSELRLSVVSKNQNTKYFTIETSARGIKYHRFKLAYKDSIITSIPKESLPDGIIVLSVLNDKGQKLCERLFFNNRLDSRLNLTLKSNKVNYLQREKVKLQLQLDSLQNLKETTISALVVNRERLETSKQFKPSILSYLLLNSELKGFIESPYYYFDETNRSSVFDLDALMLCQGWRGYKYQKNLPLTTYNYKPETYLEVSGTIGEYLNPNTKPEKPLDLNLLVFGKTPHAYTQEIDFSGKFKFPLNDIYKSNTEFFMQVVDKKGKPIDFTINLDKKWIPAIKPQEQISFSIPNYEKYNFIERMEVVNEKQQKYETAYNTVALDEVNVKGYKLTPDRQEFISYHGEPDKVISGKELKEKAPKWNFGLLSVLKYRFPDDINIINEGPNDNQFLRAVVKSYDKSKSFTYVLVDNIPVSISNYSLIESISVDVVKSIDIIKDPKDKYRYCEILKGYACPSRVALINIYTYSGNGIFGDNEKVGISIESIMAFSEHVEFYSPNYDTLSNQDWVLPENRSVIHWEPNITLNSRNEFTLEYYNDDYVGDVSIIIEAITKDGRIGYIEKTYSVKEVRQ